jgi:glycosyltransferase involved in cell wall biosynthesis
MKILHLSNDFAGSTVHAELYKRLDGEGLSQVVYCPVRSAGLVGRNAFEGQHTEIIYSPILKKIHRLFFHLKIKDLVKDVEQKVDLSEINIVHATTLFSDGAVALQLKKKYGIPYIVAVRNSDINVFMRYMPHLWTVHREVIREAEKVVFISPNLQKRVSRHWTLKGLSELLEQKGVVIANGLNDYWLTHRREASEAAVGHSIAYVGKFDSNKNVLRLMHAVLQLRQRFPDIRLHLVGGGGECEKRVLQLVAQHPECLTCHGPIYDKPLLQSIYQQCSVFAMPSKKETFGLVYLEALSQGLRVLYTRGEGIDGLFDKRVGEKVNALSQREVEEALERLLSQPEAYDLLAAEDFEPFHWESIARRYREIYLHI